MLPTATTFASLVCLLSATTRTSAGDATQLYAWRGLLDSPPTALSPALPFSGHAWHPFVLVRLPTDPFRKRSRGSTSSTSRWEVVATTLRTRRSSCGSSRVGPTRRPHTCTSEWTTALCRRDRCEPSRVSGFRVCVCVCVCVCFPMFRGAQINMCAHPAHFCRARLCLSKRLLYLLFRFRARFSPSSMYTACGESRWAPPTCLSGLRWT